MMNNERQTDRFRNSVKFLNGRRLPGLSLRGVMRGVFAGAFLIFIAGTAALAAGTKEEEGLAAVKGLKIESGTMTFAQRDESQPAPVPGKPVGSSLPARTIVKVVLNPAKGSNIHVEIWLPDAGRWNGRFVGLGNGGAAGHINPGGFTGPLTAGYAVATTDMGTAPNDLSGVGNMEVWKDFGFRATHLMTVCAKQVLKAYYGKDAEYSYFSGGSTGGQQALQEAQRYPEDYDGIVAKIPAHCRTPLHAYFLWNDQILHKCPFTDAQEANIIAAANEYMAERETPATAGKIVSDPRCDSKDIEAVIALAMKKDPTLTQEHAEAMRKLFGGPRHAVTGERIFDGIPIGSSFKAAHGHLYLFKWVFGADKDLATINFGEDIDKYTAALGPYLNAENPDLRPFEKRGGKLLMMSGSADSVVPYTATLDYYERVAGIFGSMDKVRAFFRYYIIPGMSHGGGPGISKLPDALEMVIQWREKGVVPDVIRGQRVVNGKTEMDIPIYPYPVKAGWDAATASYKAVDGARGGVERVAERFRPGAAE